jgi:hypothetical protein
MYQVDLFYKQVERTATFLGKGFYSRVFKMSNGLVTKVGGNDGTRNWLEFCMMHREAGSLMPMMPMVYHVMPLGDNHYMAVMDCYTSIGTSEYDTAKDKPAFADVRSAFAQYLGDLSGKRVYPYDAFSDIHSGNLMVCPKRGIIVTDPSSGDYTRPVVPEFMLH